MNETEDPDDPGAPLHTSEPLPDSMPLRTSSLTASSGSLSTSTPTSANAATPTPSPPRVTFHPHPIIMPSHEDGSPLKTKDSLKKDDAKSREVVNLYNGNQPSSQKSDDQPDDCYLKDLYDQIGAVIASSPDTRENCNEDEAEDPKVVPMIWISKWVDYSDKYGLGYQLCDESIGVLFNDFTKLLLLPDGESIHYIERTGNELYHTLKTYPPFLEKKVTLLRYFRTYMEEHLLKTAASVCPRENDIMARVPSLKTYFRTRSAIVLHMSNGTFQINFFEDHTKVILCPLMEAVTYIDKEKNFRTFKFEGLKEHGCSVDIANRLRYAKNMIQKLMLSKSSSSRQKSAGAPPSTTVPQNC